MDWRYLVEFYVNVNTPTNRGRNKGFVSSHMGRPLSPSSLFSFPIFLAGMQALVQAMPHTLFLPVRKDFVTSCMFRDRGSREGGRESRPGSYFCHARRYQRSRQFSVVATDMNKAGLCVRRSSIDPSWPMRECEAIAPTYYDTVQIDGRTADLTDQVLPPSPNCFVGCLSQRAIYKLLW